jgi:hypothetical protein
MLYEKTLSRKAISVSTKSRAENESPVLENGRLKSQSNSFWINVLRFPVDLCRRLRKNKNDRTKPREQAAAGKILNLMRHVISYIRGMEALADNFS